MEERALPPWEVVPGLRVPGAYGPFSRVAALATRLAGWRIAVAEPMPEKCVIVMYPHSSNWDFVFGLLTKWCVGLTFKTRRTVLRGQGKPFQMAVGRFFSRDRWFPGQSRLGLGLRRSNGRALQQRAAHALRDCARGHARLHAACALKLLLRGAGR